MNLLDFVLYENQYYSQVGLKDKSLAIYAATEYELITILKY